MNPDTKQHLKKEPETIFKEVFPTLIARKNLEPSEEQLNLMLDFMGKYESAIVEAETQNEDEDHTLLTGDTTGSASIHNAPEFQWLTEQIEALAFDYLDAAEIEHKSLSIFHQKSWPVVTRTGGEVDDHTHSNAEISAVYYLQSEPNMGGELIFENPAPSIPNGNIEGNDTRRPSKELYGLRPIPNMLIMFPSHVSHEVKEYRGTSSRWSVSYDLTITAHHSLGTGRTESMIVHPSNWKEFRGTRQR